jgi:hypothetical protein
MGKNFEVNQLMDYFPTSYFPSIFYFQLLSASKFACICGGETYIKQTFRNRCEILTGNGVQTLSIPVSKSAGSKSITNQIHPVYSENWQQDHWKSIESAYKNAPYFEFYDEEIKEIIFTKHDSLLELNQSIIRFFEKCWDLPQVFIEENLAANINQAEFLGRTFIHPNYIQVFSNRFPFQSNLSVLDLLFCEGPMGRNWILSK